MIIKFFFYDTDGDVFCRLPELPDNYLDFTNQPEDIYYGGNKVVGGLKWANIDWFYNSTGIELNSELDYIYTTGEINERKLAHGRCSQHAR